MFEATLKNGQFWKKVVDAMKDLVTEANFECTPNGMSIQSVDSSHVALVSLSLGSKGFEQYSCHRDQVLGVNLNNLAKLLKVTDDKDTVTLRHAEDADSLIIASESDVSRKNTEFSLKLMEIEAEAMGIPDSDTSYPCVISMPSDVFAKTCRDMVTFGDTMSFEVFKDKVRFSGKGDLGEGNITIGGSGPVSKAPATKANSGLKNEVKAEVKAENGAVKTEPLADDVAEALAPEKKRNGKAPAMQNDGIYINCEEEMSVTFALRYLQTFAKGAALADRVTLSVATDQPCRIEFIIPEQGSLCWFLAPKVDDNDDEEQQ